MLSTPSKGIEMSEVIHEAQQEFWRPPAPVEAVGRVAIPVIAPAMAATCPDCGKEFLVGSRFCHACGSRRTPLVALGTGFLSEKMAQVRLMAQDFSFPQPSFPAWLHYLHFHEIKRWIGLPTASLTAFIIGLGCVAGAVCVSLVYKAQTFADWQAIQYWRIEWLLAATAAFVAGILLKTLPHD
jgi:hypothetical protein